MLSPKQKRAFGAGVITLIAVLAIFAVDEELKSLRGDYMHDQSNSRQLSEISDKSTRRKVPDRRLSLNLGGGKCEWTEPVRVVSEDEDFYKTLVVGFPSGEKRITYILMEALTGLPSKDDWDVVLNGYTNAPFIKTNYPHPTGTWGWDSEADQVALVVQYIRQSMVEFSDVHSYTQLHTDLDPNNKKLVYNEDRENVEELYGQRMSSTEFYTWRDKNVVEEIYRYGWYIDYWMENGLFRHPYTNEEICRSEWLLLSSPNPTLYADAVTLCKETTSTKNSWIELDIERSQLQDYLAHGYLEGNCEKFEQNAASSGSTDVTECPKTDSNCAKITESCRPSVIISSDRLRDFAHGDAETEIIGDKLMENPLMAKWVINKEAWPCIWNKIFEERKGPKTFIGRNNAEDPNFSASMLEEMIAEVSRLIEKYSTDPWIDDEKANRLVHLLSEHIPLLETELDEVISGARTLTFRDILGPGERKALGTNTVSVDN